LLVQLPHFSHFRYNDIKAKSKATFAKIQDKSLAFTTKGLKIAAEVLSGKRMTKHEVQKHMEEVEAVYFDAIQACLTGTRLVIEIKNETPKTARVLTEFITFTISMLLERNDKITDLLTVMNAKAH
jgi:hypothetical protein